MQHSLEKKVLETTELSEKIVLLETKLDSIKDTCKGYASLPFSICLLLEGFTLKDFIMVLMNTSEMT